MKRLALLIVLSCLSQNSSAAQWVVYEPPAGKANGKHIVLLAGDEEYRSEESMPMFGKLLSQRHGFRCTVLFSQDAAGVINPHNQTNVPGLHLLADADLAVNAFRFRELPDADMKHIIDFLDAGKPMIVIRTATHAFAYSRNKQSPYAKYSYDAQGGGFGGLTVGETWTYHHGDHGKEASRGLVDGKNRQHPILRGVADVFGPTDVYGVNADFPADATVLLHGLTLTGMKPEDPPNLKKAIMPLVWLRQCTAPSGNKASILCSTIGAAVDFQSEDLRRLIVNASFFLTGLEVPARADATPVGEFNPTYFGYNSAKKGVRVEDQALK
ncbi:MAG TPA: hypothetical protein PK640_17985 [Verrucomicrobiota bacterium]|nr:hypothetical protein [Verrucomicrobiota bacterium]